MLLKKIYRFLFPILKYILYPNSTINSYLFKSIKVGKGVHISKGCNIWDTVIGNYTFIGENSSVDYVDSIGKYCSISKNVHLGLGAHPHDKVSTSPVFYSKKRGFVSHNSYTENTTNTIIENDVLIGASVCVMRGVKIATGAIIGSGSVVTKDIPPYAIAIGNPTKIIKYRFSPEVIKDLLASEWWNRDIDDLLDIDIQHLDIKEILSKLEK